MNNGLKHVSSNIAMFIIIIITHYIMIIITQQNSDSWDSIFIYSLLHHMMTSSNGNICRVTGHLCGEFTGPRWIPRHKGQWRGALMFSLICVWINGWVKNREAGDLRRFCARYDVIVMRGTKNKTKKGNWDKYVTCAFKFIQVRT